MASTIGYRIKIEFYDFETRSNADVLQVKSKLLLAFKEIAFL